MEMGVENMNKLTKEKAAAVVKLRNADTVYVIMSGCTRMPYVLCDPDTYDDEILLYYQEEEAKKRAKQLLEMGNPVQIAKIEKKNFLDFYSSLFPMGVNCIAVNEGMPEAIAVQLAELVRRPNMDKAPEEKKFIENPELHLTALYYMQKARGKSQNESAEEMVELQEEMTAHFKRGTYIVAAKDGKELAVLKQKDGKVFHPVFTDACEFRKFQLLNKTVKFQMMKVKAEKLPEIITQEAAGITVNPFGVNLQLQMKRRMTEDL